MVQDEFEMENQGYEEEALTSSSNNSTRVNPEEFSSIDSRDELSVINRSKIRLGLGGDKLRNEQEAHVYEDIGLSPESSEENGLENSSFRLGGEPWNNNETEMLKKGEIEDKNARNLSSLEADYNADKKNNFHRNLTLPLKRTYGCENGDYENRYSVRVTNRERTRFTRKNENNDSGHDTSGVGDEKHFFHRHQEEEEDEDDLPRAINHVIDKPGRRRRKKDCKHCKSKANAISLLREDFSTPESPKNPLESSPLFSSPSQLINSNFFINETEEKTRLGIKPIFPSNHQKLPNFHSPDFSPRVSDSRKNSIFSISNNVNSVITGSPKPLNYDKNETELRLTPVELNDDRALITPMKNRNGMKVNSIYSQEHWRAKDSSIFVTDVKEQTFQRAYSLPTRTHTPTSQNRVNLRRSVRGEPPPHPARLRKNRHGWTLHFARPLDGTGCTRSIVLLLITILALLGIGGIALYIVFEPEKLQVIQQYLRSSTPNATTKLNSSLVPDSLDLQTNIEITTFSTSFLTSTENIAILAQETTFPTETETEISVTSTTEIILDRNVTRHCDDCYDNEVCVALVDEEVPICRTGPDPMDPTGCSGLCLINKQKCHRLDFDAFRCVEIEHYCLDDEWTCANTLCIPLVKHCDGHMNCYDHSDEYDCACDLQTHFQCGNETSCLPVERRCDGKIDCWDATDEINCTLGQDFGWSCPSNTEFTCSNGECILKTRFCDGLRDCTDGSDEPHGCQGRCNKHEFSCLNGRCITKGMKCNGIDDCGDESDEQHCRDRIFKKIST